MRSISRISTTICVMLTLAACTPLATPSPTPPTPTPTAEPSPTPDAAATATALAEIEPIVEASAQWPIVIRDGFDMYLNDWPVGDTRNRLLFGSREVAEGKYRWQAEAQEAFWWPAVPITGSVPNFYLSVEVQRISGPSESGYGLIFRQTTQGDYYYFAIKDEQFFSFSQFYDDQWDTLLDWTKSSAIDPGGVNKLTVVAQGQKFMIFINDQFVAMVNDTRLTTGEAGVAINLLHPGDEAVFEFDNFELRSPTASGPMLCHENVAVIDQSSDADLMMDALSQAMEFLSICGEDVGVTLVDGHSVGHNIITGGEAGGQATPYCIGRRLNESEILLAVGSPADNLVGSYRGEDLHLEEGWAATYGMLHELYHVYQSRHEGCGEYKWIESEYAAEDWALANYQRFGKIISYEAPPPPPTPEPAPLEIILRDIHYEQHHEGGQYLWADWLIFNRSSQTVYHVWRPFYVFNNGKSQWGGYYDCDFGWKPGHCYRSLTEDQPDILPNSSTSFIWYAITDTDEEWIQYAYWQVLGWEFVIEFDPAGNIVRQDAYPVSGTPETPPGDYEDD